LESEYGVPTVSVQTHVFEKVARSTALGRGMPHLRQAFVPMPVMGKSDEQLRRDIEGADPVSGAMVMGEIVAMLTEPLREEESRPALFDRSTPRLLEPAGEAELQLLFREKGWTDMLPVVLPTEERVAAMLRGSSHHPDEVVGEMRPTVGREAWRYTVEKVAVNAVMAGAEPRYFPLILALAASQVSARPSTTTSAAAMVVVNGPMRHELGMNWGIGAMGPYNHANATIGRAFGLLSQNLQGGSLPGTTYVGSQSNNYAYNSLTFAENEEASPWVPFHVQRGLGREESAVSIFTGCRTTAFCLGLREKHWREHVRYMLRGMCPQKDAPVLVLDPIAARQFVERGGFDTVEKLTRWVHDNAVMPAGVYWDYQVVQNYIYPRAVAGEEPYATRLKAAEDEWIPIYRPDEVHVVVVGGETNGYWRIIGSNYRATVAVDPWR
jgi:hypothetical protein